MNIHLDEDGFVARVYFGAHHLWRSFIGDEYVDDPERTDLCTMVRTIFVTAPLALAINAVAISWATFALIYLGYALWLHATAVGIFTMFILTLAVIVGAFMFGGRAVKAAINARVTQEVIGVTADYYRAKKQRICPLVNFDGVSQ